MAGLFDMPLGMVGGLGQSHIVLDGVGIMLLIHLCGDFVRICNVCQWKCQHNVNANFPPVLSFIHYVIRQHIRNIKKSLGLNKNQVHKTT